jgi:hypothetical protein
MVRLVLPRAQMGGFSPAALEAPAWLQLAMEQSLNDAAGATRDPQHACGLTAMSISSSSATG